MAMTGRKPSYAKTFKNIAFGKNFEIYDPTCVSNDALKGRSQPCIALYPARNAQEGWVFFNIHTGKRVRRSSWTPMQMSQLVIDSMNALSAEGAAVPAGVENVEEVEAERPGNALPAAANDGIPDAAVPAEAQDAQATADPEPRHLVRPNVYLEADFDEDEDEHEDGVPAPGVEVDQPAAAEEAEPEPPSNTVVHQTPPQLRRSARIVGGARRNPVYSLSTMTLKAALREGKESAMDAMTKELKQLLITKKALKPMHRGDLTPTKLKKLIRAHTLVKRKYDARGRFEKTKARLVADGKQQDRAMYPDISSPTAALSSLFMALTIAANKKQKTAVIDIGGAYLNADMTGEEVDIILGQIEAEIAVQIDPTLKRYLTPDGRLICRLDKALYGCIQSAKLWYDKISAVLEALGYVKNPVDGCVFNKGTGATKVTIVLFVDDILALSNSEGELKNLIAELTAEFDEVTSNVSVDFSYLGMRIQILDGKVRVTMEGFIDELLKEYKITRGKATPGLYDLFERDDSQALSAGHRERFHTAVAKLLYLAMRVKPETLLEVVVLCSRVQNATVGDMKKLYRILEYVYETRDRGIELSGDKIDTITGMIDASFAPHPDGKSHTGVAVMLGAATIMVKSSKQKLVTLNSTEAELVALSDSTKAVERCNDFMTGQGITMNTPELGQDNTSVKWMVEHDEGKWRSKYMRVRQAAVRERVKAGDFIIKYVKTREMVADILTKPAAGVLFRELRDAITGWKGPLGDRGALE